MKKILIILGVVLVLLLGGTWLSNYVQEQRLAKDIEGLEQFSGLSRNHVNGDVDYDQTPPVGGPHNPVWLACNGTIYDEPVVQEQAVHALEHGAVWITYQPNIGGEQIAALEDRMAGYTFMSPLPEQLSPIVLTAWGFQLALENADDPRIAQFLQRFRQGPQTPEPGATCNATVGGMS